MIFRLGKLYVKLAEDIEKYGIFLCFTWNNPSRLLYVLNAKEQRVRVNFARYTLYYEIYQRFAPT